MSHWRMMIGLSLFLLVSIGIYTWIFHKRAVQDQKIIVPQSDEVEVAHMSVQLSDLAIPFKTDDALIFGSLSDTWNSPVLDKAAEAQFVLLGEASHGTAEYYTLRANLTKKLITDHAFQFVAVEADWGQMHRLNRYVKGLDQAPSTGAQGLLAGARWPEWMWANHQFLEFVEWLHDHNMTLPLEKRVGLYGMDVQGLSDSLGKLPEYMKRLEDQRLAEEMKSLYACFELSGGQPNMYVQQVQEGVDCSQQAGDAVTVLQTAFTQDEVLRDHELFSFHQHALLVRDGEAYLRTSLHSNDASWNLRVEYMKETIEQLSERYALMSEEGAITQPAQGIIWAHNTHVGDARATEMRHGGIINIGQLLRENYSPNSVYILGFSTYQGQVKAGSQWNATKQVMDVPPAREGSLDAILASLPFEAYVLPLNQDELPESLKQSLGQRAKGVVYNPDLDEGNYPQTIVGDRYDGIVFIRNTTAVKALQ